MKEAVALLLESDAEDKEATAVRQSREVDIIYVPPAVTEQSDEEIIDDDIIERDHNDAVLPNDIAGEVEVEYRCNSEDDEDLLPHTEPPKKKRKKSSKKILLAPTADQDQPQPSTSTAQQQTSTIEPPKYKSVADFGAPKWSKKILPYDIQPVNIEKEACQKLANDLGESPLLHCLYVLYGTVCNRYCFLQLKNHRTICFVCY